MTAVKNSTSSRVSDSTQAPASAEAAAIHVIRRVAPGHFPLTEAQQRMADSADRLGREYPDDEATRFASNRLEGLIQDSQTLLGVLFGAVRFRPDDCLREHRGFAAGPRHGPSTRNDGQGGSGASRWALARQLIIESLLLGLLGGAVALLPAIWGIQSISMLRIEELPNSDLISLNWTVLGFNLGVSVITGLLSSGCAPAVTNWKTNVSEALKATGPALGGGAHQRLRSSFVVGEIALTLVLLVGAGLALQSFLRLRSSNPGYTTLAVLLTLRVALSERQYPDVEKQRAFFDRVIATGRELFRASRASQG